MKSVTKTFTRERETKNKVVFREATDAPEVVGSLYVAKWWAKDLQSIEVTLDASR